MNREKTRDAWSAADLASAAISSPRPFGKVQKRKKERKKGVLSASYFCVGEMPNWKMSKNDGGLVSLLHIAYRSMPRHEMRRTRTRNSFVGSTVFHHRRVLLPLLQHQSKRIERRPRAIRNYCPLSLDATAQIVHRKLNDVSMPFIIIVAFREQKKKNKRETQMKDENISNDFILFSCCINLFELLRATCKSHTPVHIPSFKMMTRENAFKPMDSRTSSSLMFVSLFPFLFISGLIGKVSKKSRDT